MDVRRRSAKRAFGLALLLAAFSACSDKPEDSTKALAIINGKEITASEFDLRWSQIPDFARKTYAGHEGRKKFLDDLITRELLIQEARRRGFDRDRALAERVERFKEQLAIDNLMREEVASRTTVTLEEMRAYYAANSGSFTAPDELRASHILVKTEEEAQDLKKRLDEGEDFAAVARKASLDLATRYKGGDLGLIKKGQAVPQFEKALLSLKIGEVSSPVATQFGWHLIKLNDRATGAPQSFEDAKDQVKEQILNEKKHKRFEEFKASLRAKAKLRVADVPIPVSEVPAARPTSGDQ